MFLVNASKNETLSNVVQTLSPKILQDLGTLSCKPLALPLQRRLLPHLLGFARANGQTPTVRPPPQWLGGNCQPKGRSSRGGPIDGSSAARFF